MAINGLFTQGPSIDELLSKRNQRGTALQQQLVQQAGQGSRDPMQAQAAALIGSSLGRALAGKMDGGKYEAGLQAKADAKNATQQQYLTAAGADTSAAMYDMVKLLKKDNPIAAFKMLELAKAKKKEEKDEADAKAAAIAAKVETLRLEGRHDEAAALIASAKVEAASTGNTADQEAAALLASAEVKAAATSNTADQEAAALLAGAKVTGNLVTQITGKELKVLNPELDVPDGAFFNQTAGGKLTQLGGKGQVINIENMGAIPKDHILKRDADNNPYYEVIKGSPTERAQLAAAEKEAQAAANKVTGSTVVNDAIGQALEIAEEDSITRPIFGKLNMGKLAGTIEGSGRAKLEAIMKPILADAAFSTLSDMRAASQTGGALGAINTAELEMLKNARGALDISQGKEMFVKNLRAYRLLYNDAQHGTRAAIAGYNKRNPNKEPLVYWRDAELEHASGPNAAMPASVAQYYQE